MQFVQEHCRGIVVSAAIMVVAISMSGMAGGEILGPDSDEDRSTAINESSLATQVQPNPVTTQVDIPDSVTVGEPITADVEAENQGSTAGSFSTITVASPSLTDSSDGSQIAVTDHDLEYSTTVVQGETIIGQSGEEISAEYALAEAGTTADGTWEAGESHSATVEFTPESTGTFIIDVRTTLTDPNSDQAYTDPSDSGTVDQQGFAVRRYTVEVREEPEIDAEIIDQSVSTGEFERGETVEATAEVENTGNREHTFFVGYTVFDESDTGYDNDRQTGQTVTLAPGETSDVSVSWDVPNEASAGEYDALLSVWEESDRDALATRLAETRVEDAFSVRQPPSYSAEIVDVSFPDGQYDRGGTVPTTVVVENTGNRENTVFVGYSVYDESGQPYDNENQTGEVVTLDPGEQRELTLDWSVSEDAPPGTYDTRVSVWNESDRDELSDRLADVRRDETFEVAPEVEVIFNVSKESTIDGYEFSGEPIPGATISINGETRETNDEGATRFQVPLGEHEYTVTADGYEMATNTLNIDSETTQVVSVPLTQTGTGVLQVDVVDDDNSPAPGNAYQILIDGDQVSPNAEGELLLEEGTYDLRIEPTDYGQGEGYVPTDQSVTVEAGERTTVTLSPTQQTVNAGELNYSVQEANGKSAVGDVFHLNNSMIDSITIRIQDSSGSPVVGVSPQLQSEHGEELTASEVSDGLYRFTPSDGVISGYTGVRHFNISFAEANGTATIDIPVNDVNEPLPQPIEGWASAASPHGVTVDGNEYQAARLEQHSENGIHDRAGWMIFTKDGELVQDNEIVRRAGLTAEMSLRMQDEETMETFLGEEYPQHLDRILSRSMLLHQAIAVRDTSASVLGQLTTSVATGGAGAATIGTTQIADKTGEQAAKTAANEIASGVADQIAEEQVQRISALSNNEVLDLFERSTRQKAHDELRAAREQAESAAAVLAERDADEQWTFEDAQMVWRAYNESLYDGLLWSEVRVQTMPSGAPVDQLQSIAVNFADGATGESVPVSDFAELLQSGEAGDGYQRALEETAEFRRSLNRTEQTWTQYSPALQAEALDTFGTGSVFEDGPDSSGDATIEIVEQPSGSYAAGDSVNATVRIENSDNTPQRVFVGYSLRTDGDSGPLFFDNGGTTGHWITLGPLESTTTTVSWEAQSNAPTEQQYDAIIAVWESYPANDVERYDDAVAEDIFELQDTSAISVTGVSGPSTVTTNETAEFTITAENTGTADGEVLVNATTDGGLVGQGLVSVPNSSTASANLSLNFSTPGDHTITVGDQSATITVTESTSTPSESASNETTTSPEPQANESTTPSDTDTNETTATETPTGTATETPSESDPSAPEDNATAPADPPTPEEPPADSTNATNTTASDNETGSDTESTLFEIVATEEGEITYEVVIQGSVEPASVSDQVAAEGNDEIRQLDNGTVVIEGYTGNTGFGDAFRIDGEIIDYRRVDGDVYVTLRLDGESVTPSTLSANDTQGDSSTTNTTEAAPETSVFEIVATDEGEITYTLTVVGTVEPTETSETIAAEGNDEIHRFDNGTVIIEGFTGNPGFGDAYEINGEIVGYERVNGNVPVNLFVDGETVTPSDLSNDASAQTENDQTETTPTDETQGPSIFEIIATEDGEITYELEIDGTATKTSTNETIEAEGNDEIRQIDDDTVVIEGYTGNAGFGDAYEINGEIVEYRRIDGDIEVNLRLNEEPINASEL